MFSRFGILTAFLLGFIFQNLEGSNVNPNLKIHQTASIHPSVIMEGDIEIGANTTIGANSYLKGPLIIGKNNQIGGQVMIGVNPEHKTKQAKGVVTIGDGNVIREFSVIQRGIGDLDTQIQNNCFIMAYAYIAHDCLVESDVILCARVSLSGHCHILKGAILGLSSSTHQFTTIGPHAFVGMGSVVVKDVPPFCIVVGNPAHFEKFNPHPFEQLGISLEDLAVEDGHLKSQNSYVNDCIKSFSSHVRRKAILIKDGGLATGVNHYIAILSKIGDPRSNCGSEAIIPLCTNNCKKVRNGKLLFEGRELFAAQLNSGKEWLGAWSIDVQEILISETSRTATIRYNLATEKEGSLTVFVVLYFDKNNLIHEINEVHNKLEK